MQQERGAPLNCKAQPMIRITLLKRHKARTIMKRHQKHILGIITGSTKIRHRKKEDQMLKRQSGASKGNPRKKRRRASVEKDQPFTSKNVARVRTPRQQ